MTSASSMSGRGMGGVLFNETTFLYWFLPIVLVLYYEVPVSARNFVLAVASLVFYSWGEFYAVGAMLLSILFNYSLGLAVERDRGQARAACWLAIAVLGNLLFLGFFKYTNFTVANLNILIAHFGGTSIEIPKIPLPIGVSFFTFQAMSYVIDVYRGEAPAQRSLLNLTLYIALFPQLIAGPIVRYLDIALQLNERKESWVQFASGVQRFVLGLGKKMMLANAVALPADQIFALPPGELTTSTAWFGVICYTLHIYLDFSAYSDMAIGLGRMFGFEFLENFDYPYIACSVTAFWRRWHKSLSSWFRDYVYIPLGGNRISRPRTYFNLLTVFFLCGLWHGANWTFVLWGLYHGFFLIMERIVMERGTLRIPRWTQHVYTLLVVMMGWVMFKADTVAGAIGIYRALLGFAVNESNTSPLALFATRHACAGMIFGALACMPLVPWASELMGRWERERPTLLPLLDTLRGVSLLLLLFGCALLVAADTYNPFIYFRF
ncbi:MAG: MBOAT family protein [Planctomycetales bacterium]|nr:MBOAT family protein [Planctomycetales bacterium]MCA9168188.1 MBOAT family protein [Planctomycetales bacterium]